MNQPRVLELLRQSVSNPVASFRKDLWKIDVIVNQRYLSSLKPKAMDSCLKRPNILTTFS